MGLLFSQYTFKTIKKSVNFALDTIFPKYCITCETEGGYLCQKCFLKVLNAPFQGAFNTEKIIIAGSYKNRYLKEVIHFFKYRCIKELANPVAFFVISYLEQRFDKNFFNSKNNVIIPVPLHPKKLRKRGYNQLTKFGKVLSNHLEIKFFENDLTRISSTKTQTLKARFERFKNIDTKFLLKNPDYYDNKHVLLIDDVITTGATLEACAKEFLKSKNSKNIFLEVTVSELQLNNPSVDRKK